jgi:hypothetical protein
LVTRRLASVLAKFLLMRSSFNTLPAKLSTTAEIAGAHPGVHTVSFLELRPPRQKPCIHTARLQRCSISA